MAPDPETCKSDNNGGRMKGILTKGYLQSLLLNRRREWPAWHVLPDERRAFIHARVNGNKTKNVRLHMSDHLIERSFY